MHHVSSLYLVEGEWSEINKAKDSKYSELEIPDLL
jgi:hypothetical protein